MDSPTLSPKTRPIHSTAYRDAKELQRLLMHDARDPGLKPITRAALARAFCELEETKRKLKMKPLPKAVDVTLPRKSGSKASASGISE